MSENLDQDYFMEPNQFAEFLRDIADALENMEQLNIEIGDRKVVQPLGGKVPLRIYQDEEGTEIGFKLVSGD